MNREEYNLLVEGWRSFLINEVSDPYNENNPELSRLMKIDRDIAVAVLDKNIEISEKIFRVDEAILDVRQIISVAKLNSNQRAQTYGNELSLKFKTYLRHLSNDFN